MEENAFSEMGVTGSSILSQNLYVEDLPPSTQECDLFGDGAFKKVIRLNKAVRVGPNPT